jgi:hypothetical protein
MSTSGITTLDFPAIEAVLGMESGYVLHFTNRTFANFFAELGIDIDKEFPEGSKAKRLRALLHKAEPALAARVLEELLAQRGQGESDDQSQQLSKYRGIIARLRGVRVASTATVSTEVLSLAYVTELEAKTDKRLANADFEGAITTARTMLEAVLLELERRMAGCPGDHKGDLQRLFKSVAKQLRIDEERQDLDDNFKQVVRGLVQIVNGLAPIRNKMSDGHPRERKPAAHHARVIVNAAKTVATFLVESYLFQRERGLLPAAQRTAQ